MRLLFQGDSITDFGRSKDNTYYLGSGYATMVAGDLMSEYPCKFECINKGISGNRIVDVYARIKADITNLKPDIMTLLIGVNDVWHEVDFQNGVCPKRFNKMYRLLIEDILEELPDIKIIILEPYLIRGTATDSFYDEYIGDVLENAKIARQIAKDYGFPFVELQKDFEELTKNTPRDYWLFDGVHPNIAGHGYIAKKLKSVIVKELGL